MKIRTVITSWYVMTYCNTICSFLFPQCWNSAVRVPVHTACSEFRNTSPRIPEIAMHRKCGPPSAGDCSKCTNQSEGQTGNGLRTF